MNKAAPRLHLYGHQTCLFGCIWGEGGGGYNGGIHVDREQQRMDITTEN